MRYNEGGVTQSKTLCYTMFVLSKDEKGENMSQSEKDIIKRIAEEHPEAFKEMQKVMNKGSFFEHLTNFEPKKDLSDE